MINRYQYSTTKTRFYMLICLLLTLFMGSCLPEKDIELRQIKSVVGDITDEPTLKADVIFFNPNPQKGILKRIEADVYVEGKKAARVDQQVKIKVPANGEFTIPIEIKINLKEQGVMNTLLSLIGAKKIKVRYKGHVKVIYRGLPVRVPIDREEEVRIRL
jgi:LEA14-like dessication related protein